MWTAGGGYLARTGTGRTGAVQDNDIVKVTYKNRD